MNLEAISSAAQKCVGTNPVIVLGSGASAPFGMASMGELATHLVANVKTTTTAASDAWLLVRTALSQGDHLEQALLDKQLPRSLVEQIVIHTWNYMSAGERKVFEAAAKGTFQHPISEVIRLLLRSSNKTIEVVTTNYDRLIELALDNSGVHYMAGFIQGYLRSLEPADKFRLLIGGKQLSTVRIWKVHGSMDWYEREDETSYYSPFLSALPPSHTPLIVTPGVSKYERITDEPFRSTMSGADNALSNASGYLCFGFGFRDKQIEPKMVARLRKSSAPIIVATKSLTPEAAQFLQSKSGSDFLALEEEDGQTRARYPADWNGSLIPGNYWSIDGFYSLIA